jgi:hypothetical protein
MNYDESNNLPSPENDPLNIVSAPIVGCKDDNYVVLDPCLFDAIQGFSGIGIRLRQNGGKIVVSGFAFEIGMGVMRCMSMHIWNADKK